MNATRETVDPAMRAAAEDVCGEYMDIIPGETRNLMGFYVSLRKLLIECGITDFSFQDLYKPTHDRLVKIFSYIINFVRFRESQTPVIDEHFNKAETTKVRIETLYMENQDMEARLDEMKRNRKAMEAHVAEKVKRNEELKQRLLSLRQGQEKVTRRFEDVKAKKSEMTAILEDKTATTLVLRQESAKLRPYVLQSPAALQASLTDLSNALNAEKAQIDAMDRRARALQTSTDTFSVVSTDVASCIKLLDEISAELAKEEEENIRIARQRDALGERGNNVREVERTEGLLQRQLSKWVERTDKLRDGSKEKAMSAKDRMEELRAVHRKLTEERTEKGRDMERRRVRIEQTEKKVCGFVIHVIKSKLTRADGGPEREHRERDSQCARRVLEDGLAYQAIHHRDGAVDLSFQCSYSVLARFGWVGWLGIGVAEAFRYTCLNSMIMTTVHIFSQHLNPHPTSPPETYTTVPTPYRSPQSVHSTLHPHSPAPPVSHSHSTSAASLPILSSFSLPHPPSQLSHPMLSPQQTQSSSPPSCPPPHNLQHYSPHPARSTHSCPYAAAPIHIQPVMAVSCSVYRIVLPAASSCRRQREEEGRRRCKPGSGRAWV